MPLLVGSAVDVLQISVSPKYINASLSNCRPLDVTVKFMVTRLNLQSGGVYVPGLLSTLQLYCWRERTHQQKVVHN